MKYGCIGEKLGHSFSKEIHALIADYDYTICEVAREQLDSFMKESDFLAVNVTIPYKEAVIPYLSHIDESAKLIGAVNTIVKRDGKLYGYNTDFYGMNTLLRHSGIDLRDKKVLILGTGGTSKTAYAVAKLSGAREIIFASRTASGGTVLYEDIYKYHTDSEVIINTTPVGMFPDVFKKPIEISAFDKLCGVIDAIYNPSKTPLILDAEKRGIPAEGGLYMLVAQAVKASEYFLDTDYRDGLIDDVFNKIKVEKLNIVLTGMPGCGKSTVAKIIASKLSRRLTDTDALITEYTNRDIPSIFKESGEETFRDLESAAIKSVSAERGIVIATGGGTVLREENVRALLQNGKIYFIDRPLPYLIPTPDRPTASSKEEIERRYYERYGIYRSTADVIIDADCNAQEVADKIIRDFIKK